ncbi:MAG: adenylyltransferase/cytidyltransferase family protein [Candidatus Marinimicrobia bacterium]|jgi:D-beta-D-heptose 7-phosphate kinase/D-beta-D-heptose 1-phosphate adenosyltransferase|nr:adenylyltransferase/cytidyltransferase family protein [Candidatus Neomarinimicrobiota bacterium]MDD4960620.1 adenylyltransferase/cytidyltransferase family protein [Candidatus Neomarinimicrobiota bacterium]MDD5709598.1 adenylyltransferase/cytidyltransferase family protein [Candidatus Neomarinimicrobiota bacterium]MDX9777458.1 adenylyltransferase/cytidyltransferase family protein [bacterium]
MKKVYTTTEWPALLQQCTQWKKDGDTLVFTNGCFDGLHPGHRALLAFAGEQGKRLIVALNDDAGVRKLKGTGRPRNTEALRAKAILEQSAVDAVVFFGDPTPERLIRLLHPDCLIKGGDYSPETIAGADFVRSYGGRLLIFPRISGFSSSDLYAEKKEKL